MSIYRWFLSVILIIVGTASCMPASSTERLNLTIAHTNDLEGSLDPCSCLSDPAGGASRRATALQGLRAQNAALLLVDAGDALFGTPIANANEGLAQVAVMNALGYDAAALGDRDFLYGLDFLQKVLSAAKFPFLSANVVWMESGLPITQASVILEKGGVKVGILGLTTTSVDALIQADLGMQQKIKVLDPIQVARQQVAELAQKTDAVVILSHLGSVRDEELIKQVPGITAVIGGHSREMVVPTAGPVKQAPLAIVGYQGDTLGVLNLTFDAQGRSVEVAAKNIKLSSSLASDPKMSAILAHYKAIAVVRADLPLSLGLGSTLPLEVHQANPSVQLAYLFATAYPDVLAATRVQVEGLASGEKSSLLSCFILNGEASDYQYIYTLKAIQTPQCVEQANRLLEQQPRYRLPQPVMALYWSTQ